MVDEEEPQEPREPRPPRAVQELEPEDPLAGVAPQLPPNPPAPEPPIPDNYVDERLPPVFGPGGFHHAPATPPNAGPEMAPGIQPVMDMLRGLSRPWEQIATASVPKPVKMVLEITGAGKRIFIEAKAEYTDVAKKARELGRAARDVQKMWDAADAALPPIPPRPSVVATPEGMSQHQIG